MSTNAASLAAWRRVSLVKCIHPIPATSGAIALATAVMLSAVAAAQQPYTFVSLEPGGTAGSEARATTEDGVVYGFTRQPGDYFSRATRWSGDPATYSDITPAGFSSAVVLGLQRGVPGGTLALGSGEAAVVPPRREALVWYADGTAVVITPPGFNNAYAVGGSASGFAGYARPEGDPYNHAMFWTGPAAAQAIDLHADGYQETFAMASDGDFQVGYGRPVGQAQNHAYLWQGTAASLVDLTPTGITAGYALSIDGDQVGGYIRTAGLLRAVIWDAQAHAMTSLHYQDHESGIFFVRNGRQVGHRTNTLGRSRATLWSGTPESATDLSVYMPATYINSVAHWITADGTRIVGAAFNTTTAQYEAVMWEAPMSPPGDLDGDGDVDINDLGILLADFGCVNPPAAECPGDADGDGDTDIGDLGIVLANFGA